MSATDKLIDELLPCPFCGAHLMKSETFSSRSQTTFVHRRPDEDFSCVVEGTIISTSDPERISKWNTRADT